MNNVHQILLIRIALLFLFLASGLVFADILKGKVVAVTDGDTVRVLDANKQQYKIRLLGIDAPEKRQPFGNKSKQSLSDLVFGKNMEVHYRKTDRYGRVLGKIVLNGLDINLEQIKRGFAWYYKKYEKSQEMGDRKKYFDAEVAARAAKVGLWTQSSELAVAPWDFRKNRGIAVAK